MTTVGSLVTEERSCTRCDGALESELVSVHPMSEVCLDCMPSSERARLEKELNQVQSLDRSLLIEPPVLSGWEIGLHYRPSRLLSGDFYDVRLLGGELMVLVGDVMGKGLPAALLRVGLQSTFRAVVCEAESCAEVLRRANRHFSSVASPGRLASVFFGIIDTRRGGLRYASAGHSPPLLRRASGGWSALDATGMVFGVRGHVEYEERRVDLEPGDVLAIFSDGLTEQENTGGDVFDERRLESTIDRLPGASARQMASAVADALHRFAPNQVSDDRTLVMVKRA